MANSYHHGHAHHRGPGVDTKRRTAKPRRDHIHSYKIAHMVGVAEYMRDRADDYRLDGNVAYTAGFLHDIGFLEGRVGHEAVGAEILEACGMHGDIVSAVRNHAARLRNLPPNEITPILILMVEADLSVDAYGYRVGFEGRLGDLRKRYGDSEKMQILYENVRFIEDYGRAHQIPAQDDAVRKEESREWNHGSGRWVGSGTRAAILNEKYKNCTPADDDGDPTA